MMRRLSLLPAFVAALASIAVADDGVQPLLDRLIYHHQDWGELGINTCAHAPNTKPLPLTIGETTYLAGLGTHANGELVFMLDGQFKSFRADLGVQPQFQGVGSVVFAIRVDGEQRHVTDMLRENHPPVPVEIDLTGADELRIIISDAGDGITCDVANIGNPRLTPNPNAKETDVRRLEISSFGTVKTWPPTLIEGTQGKRTEPFPAEDIYLGARVQRDSDSLLPVPVDANGTGCIGLEWAERRLLREVWLLLADEGAAPSPDNVTAQVWNGESPWQGQWEDVPARPVLENDTQWDSRGARMSVTMPFPKDAARRGTEKIRWLFRDCPPDLRVRSLRATTFSRLREEPVALRMMLEHEDWPSDKAPLLARFPELGLTDIIKGTYASDPRTYYHVGIYNGFLVTDRTGGFAIRPGGWQDFRISCADARYWKADRPVLQFFLPEHPVAVSVDDVLEHGSVYVPSAGLIVARADVETSLEHERAKTVETPSLLDQVRAMPDQTLAQAMEHVHNPVQDLGPTMLSLACDNRKFVAHRSGSITFEPYAAPDDDVPYPDKYRYRLDVLQDGQITEPETRTLRGDWLPAPLSTWRKGSVMYTQCVYVAPLDDAAVDPQGWLIPQAACVIELEARVEGSEPASVDTEIRLVVDAKAGTVAPFDGNFAGGFDAAASDGQLYAIVLAEADSMLAPALRDGNVVLSGELKPGQRARMRVLLPAWQLAEFDAESFAPSDTFERFARYWEKVLAPAMQVSVPDPFLTNLIRASQVHCLLAARNEDNGARVAAWISSDRYGPLESEAHSVIRGMDLLGHTDYAQRSLDFFIHRYAPEGYLTTGYTIMGTGWHLWTLAEHVARTGNTEWLQHVAPDVARACQWIVDERQKTMKHPGYDPGPGRHPARNCPPECGLMPPTVAADWNRYAYRFFQEGHYYAGLKQAGAALQSVNWENAQELVDEADALRDATLRAYRYTQGRAPVQALNNGAWIPAYPGMLYSFGRIEDIIPGEDSNRSWCYDVELGAHHLAVLGVLDPQSDEVGEMLEHMEEFWFLHQGMGDYPEEKNKADWFNLGGFAKVQPYYARNAELYAMRDDVKPFIRSYFNTIPTLVSRENLSFWEHFHNMGGWNKTHETGYFLAQTREMLVQERANELWLAPLITDQWLNDGNRILVREAPTTFGRVSYSISSDVANNTIRITIEPTFRVAPEAIVVRLRHPQSRTITDVTATGCERAMPSDNGESVRLLPPFAPMIEVDVKH